MMRVVDWDDHFENNRTRELVKMRWVPFKNSFDSDGFIELLEDHEDGIAHFGAWVLMVEVASTCDPRGTLVRCDGKPHDASSLARKTRGKSHIFQQAIDRLISIGWIEETAPQEGATISQATVYGRKEGREGREGNESRTKKFIPPSVEEVSKYCAERKNSVDAQMFHDFYTAKSWMVGKNKIKDWKACVRTWERRDNNKGYSSAKTAPTLQDLT